MAKMEIFNDELGKAGVMRDCDGLQPSKEGKRVRFNGATRSVIDGTFQGDLVAGYWIWELASIEDAVAWVKRAPTRCRYRRRSRFDRSRVELAD
jgi:hypothetical protein